ncbi:MAG: linear amide C-N hydrolase, partial [Anaerolineales bacterium]|nr:linear amide C-N hydrolase [Anaerolineales bacterium]
MYLHLKHRWSPRFLSILIFGILALASCQNIEVEQQAPSPTINSTLTPTSEAHSIDFTQAEIASLNSLQKVDEYPLFVMYYQGPLREVSFSAPGVNDFQQSNLEQSPPPPWACSLFATLADPQSGVLGRNFDWEFSPALLLFTDPPIGYASVSMVDLAYFFDTSTVTQLMDLDINARGPLLNTPLMPFDGMNEKGLAVGMAAVPQSPTPSDPNNENVGSLRTIRMILDNAATVEEALTIMESVNILWGGGPPLHYLLADASGTAVLVEFVAGEMVVIYNTNPWHQ